MGTNKLLASRKSIAPTISTLLSVVLAFVVSGIVVALLGFHPAKAFYYIASGAFGNKNNIAETLVKTATFGFCGLSYAVAFRCGIFNIGTEGQMFMGALFSVFAATAIQLPPVIHVIVAVLAGALGGMLWGMLAAWLKVQFGASEVITTVMLNYVAIYFVSYMVTGPMKAPGASTPTTAITAETANLPVILSGTRLHFGFILLILSLIAYKIFMWHTPRGYQMRVVGANPNAAAYSGINANRNIFLSLALSGGFGGIAGACEILGVQHKLIQSFSNNYGYTGIAVGLLGSCLPIGIFLSAVLFAALQSGGNNLQMFMQVPSAVMFIIQGFVVIFVVADVFGGFRKLFELKTIIIRATTSKSDPPDTAAGTGKVE